jgi:hypothetical protein
MLKSSLELAAITALALTGNLVSAAQGAAIAGSPPPAMTADQNHQEIMDRLGIKVLRPGPSGDETAPNHANYDESKANPYPNLPDALMLNNGTPVTSAEMWWKVRRPQIVDMYEEDVYGRVPEHVPPVTWTVKTVDSERIGFNPVLVKDLVGHVDNSADPAVKVDLRMTLVLPANAKGRVPVLIMFGHAGFPYPHEPSDAELERINDAWKAVLERQDPSLEAVFAQHPAWQPLRATPFQPPQLNADGCLPNTWQLIDAGWGYAMLDPTTAQADNGAGLSQGIIGLVSHGQARKPDDWGALRAWAWAAGKGLDYLQTDPAIDAHHVGIEGVSRYGKAALLTMAMDQRFAMVLVGSSGKGGATPLRRNFGEAVESLTGGEFYWMAPNFLKYGASEATFGSKTPNDIPVDSNELIALCAPRLTFISYGIPEKGDAKWLDQRGSFMATVDASKVWTLLGAQGLGLKEDYHTAAMPPVNDGLLHGSLAWRQDDGGHTDAPNMEYFIAWVDQHIGYGANK